ncbi:MAG: hypothetical protein ACK56I_16795, partial [bacterium]
EGLAGADRGRGDAALREAQRHRADRARMLARRRPAAVAVLADRVEPRARRQVLLRERGAFADRSLQRDHVALAEQHRGGGRERHLEAGEVVGPEERVVGPL